MRCIFDLDRQVQQAHHHIRLSQDFTSDLQWWASFLPLWNGKSMLHWPDPQHCITADASGSWGCGAFSLNGEWFQLQWPPSWERHHIVAKELVPVVMAISLLGGGGGGSNVSDGVVRQCCSFCCTQLWYS